jgi:hypothetical protein
VAKDFSIRHGVQTSSGAHSAFCQMGIWGSFFGNGQGREADHSPPSGARLSRGAIAPLSYTSSRRSSQLNARTILHFTIITNNTVHFINPLTCKSKLCYDRRSVGQSVLVSSTHLRSKTRFLLLSDSCGLSYTTAAGPRQRSHSRVRVHTVAPFYQAVRWQEESK